MSTNRPGWSVNPAAVYDEYAERGESENRNKELKRELAADRLSDHRFLATFFRLYLHAAALNLLVRLRRATARPLFPATDPSVDIPAEALAGRERQARFNRRRREDPLGEGFASTWRQRLIKVAAEITVSARRVLVRLSASWPYVDEYRRISQAVLAVPRTGRRLPPSRCHGPDIAIQRHRGGGSSARRPAQSTGQPPPARRPE